MRWGHDLPEELAPLSFILRARTVPLRNLGGCMSPDNAWMIVQGIETLSLRMERHVENAMKAALHLKDHVSCFVVISHHSYICNAFYLCF